MAAKLRLLFFGTDRFASTILTDLVRRCRAVERVTVACPTDHRGVPCEVARFARAEGLEEIPVSGRKGLQQLGARQTFPWDLVVAASFGHLIPERIIERSREGALNVHPSRLPRWRGAAPIARAMLAGVDETWISICELSPRRFDHGRILLERRVELPSRTMHHEVTRRLAVEGGDCIVTVVNDLHRYQANSWAQSDVDVVHAPKLTTADAQVLWETETRESVARRFCAVSDYYPLWTMPAWPGAPSEPLLLYDLDLSLPTPLFFRSHSNPTASPPPHRPGTIAACRTSESSTGSDAHHGLAIACADGWTVWRAARVRSRARLPAKQFAMGYLKMSHVARVYSVPSVPS